MDGSFIGFIQAQHPILQCLVLDGIEGQQSVLEDNVRHGMPLFAWDQTDGLTMKNVDGNMRSIDISQVKSMNDP